MFWGRMVAAIALAGSMIWLSKRERPDARSEPLAKHWLAEVLPSSNADIVVDPKVKSLIEELRKKRDGAVPAGS
jgi:hypothetical protein